jgi:hypothetical protein
MNEVHVHYDLTPAIVLDRHRAFVDRKTTAITKLGPLILRLMCFLWFCMGLYFLAYPPKDRGPDKASPVLPLLGIGGIGLFGPWILKAYRRWSVEQQVARLPKKSRWLSWTITPDDIEIRDHLSQGRFKWAALSEAIEYQEGFLFLIGSDIGHWLPASSLGSAEEGQFISDWARRRVPKYRNQKKIHVAGKSGRSVLEDEL